MRADNHDFRAMLRLCCGLGALVVLGCGDITAIERTDEDPSGKSTRTLTAGGLERSFVYYAPPSLEPTVPAPVVIVVHGFLMSGEQMFDVTQYHLIADREGFVVLYPDGEPDAPGPWNVGEGACPSGLGNLPVAAGDDQAFIDAMLDFVEGERSIDRARVFVTGFSMGGYFSNETGCLRPDIAAIGAHSGGSRDLADCPVTRKPVIVFHGSDDGLIPVSCGEQTRARWAERNGCGTEVDVVSVLGGTCEYSRDCPSGGQVAFCSFEEMAHAWAGGQGIFGASDYESASELGWSFFEEHAW